MKNIKLSKIKPNPNNPRIIKDDKFFKLVKSLETFGEKMMPLRPIVIDENNIILGGNMRFKALKELGYSEVPENWIATTKGMSEEDKKEFIIKDNVGFGDWDFDMLSNEWNTELLSEWSLEIPTFDDFFDYDDVEETDQIKKPSASDDDYSTFELIMLHENKLILLDALNKVKNNFMFEKIEDALMEIIRKYNTL